MQLVIRWMAIVILILSLAACGAGTGTAFSNAKLNVVATTGQIHDAVRNIAGDKVNLTGLLGPGVDPHLYVPTEGNVSTFSQADLIFWNGLHLEAQMTRMMEQLGSRGITVVAVGEQLPSDKLLDWASAAYDPHVWNDPLLWSIGVEAIRDTLIMKDPENGASYRENASRYLAEIKDTDAYIREQVSRIPDDKRIMITAHDAFGYFARSYGLEVLGLQGISTESEAGTSDVQNLAAYIVEKRVPAIFVESSVSPRTIESVQAAVQDKGFEVKIGGQLYSDALAGEGHEASTYNGMLRYNARVLADALSQSVTGE